MNIKTLTKVLSDSSQTQFHTLSGYQDREFIVETMKKIITDSYVTGTNKCWRCNVVLLQRTKTKEFVMFKKFKNQHEAMIHGTHNPSCKFRKAVSVLLSFGEL